MISLSASVVLADTITGTGWKGTAGNNNWSSTGNWDSAAPNTVGTGDRNLFFGQGWHNAGRTGATTANNDLTNWAGYRITFENISGGANQSFSLTGNGFTLFDFGGGYPRIENDSSVLQTINLSGTLTLSGTGGGGYAEVNPVGGDLTISNAVDLAGTTQLRVWGNNGRTLTVGTISSTGNSGNNSFVLKQNSTVIFKGANTYAGSTALDAGTVRVDVAPTGSGITSSYFVGNGGTTGTSATLLLGGGAGGASGGITFGNAVSANLGSGGNRTIGGSNTTGTNTFSGTVTLNDSNATLVAATGGTVAFNTITAASVQTVAIGGGSNNGTVQFGGTGDNVNVAATVNTGSLLLAKTSSASVHAVGGGLTVNAGATAQLAGTGGDQIFNSSSVTVNNGGAFDANDRSETITNLSLAGTGISGGGALLNSGTGSATIAPSGSTTLAAATTIGVANSAASLALSGKVTGGGTLTKTGAGLLTLNGSTSDYSGATTLAGGILNSGATAALGTGNITFTGGTLQYGAGSAASDYASRIKNSTSTVTLDTNGQSVTLGGVIDGSNTSGLTKIGAGTLTLQGDNSYGGATTISGGMLVQDRNGGSIPDTSAVILANTTGAILHLNHNETIGSLSGGGGSGGNVELVNRHLTTGDGANTSYGGVISGNATSELIKQGSGLFTLTNANTYDGLTTVSQGTLEVTSNNALGTATTGTTVASGAVLKLNGVNYTTAEAVSINGTGIINSGALVNSGASTFAGAITAATNATINAGGGTLTFTGGLVKNGTTLTLTGGGTINVNTTAISGSSSNSDLVVDGTTVNLNVANSYNGPTYIRNNGTVFAGAVGALPASPRSDVVLDDTGSGVSDLILLASNTAASLTGAATSEVTISTGTAFTVGAASGATTFSGIVSGAGDLIKDGASTLVLAGSASSYTGATSVTAGTLEISANNALGSFVGGTIVGSGAALVLNNVNYSTAEPLTINGSGISNGGALANAPGGTSTFAGPITAASNATIHDGGLGSVLNLTGGIVKNGTTLTLTGGGQTNISNLGISGAAANSDLVVDGTIVVTTAASTYNGPTSIQNFATFVANNTSGSATGTGNVTVDSTSTLGGTGAVAVGTGSFIYVSGSLVVGDPTLISPAASSLTLNTSGGGSTVLGALSTVYVDIFSGDGLGDNTSLASAADYVKLFGALDNTLGGTLTIGNPNSLSGFASGDSWKLFDLGSPTPTGSISGAFVLDYSSLGLGPTLAGSFDNTTGVFSIYTVPEPSRAVLILSGALLGFVRRRRRA